MYTSNNFNNTPLGHGESHVRWRRRQPSVSQLQRNQKFEAEQLFKSLFFTSEEWRSKKLMTSDFWPILTLWFDLGSLWICNQILIWGSCEQSWRPALQHNCNPAWRNTSWIMFHEAAPVIPDPSERRKGERSEDVLLAPLLATTQTYIFILTSVMLHIHNQFNCIPFLSFFLFLPFRKAYVCLQNL